MPLEVTCPSCSGHFRVPDSAAGKKIRCPKCKGAMDVPAAEAATEPAADAPEFVPPSPPAPAPVSAAAKPSPPRPGAAAPPAKSRPQPEMWFFKSEEGDDYGPVPKNELDDWLAEGRITADCQLLREGSDQWQWAGDVYAELNDAGAALAKTVPSPTQKSSTAKSPESSVAAKDDIPPSTRSRLVAGLLGIFLGPLGTHRFYLGYWVIGLVMLATGGGCGIWSLIDAILIFVGKVPDADGKRLA